MLFVKVCYEEKSKERTVLFRFSTAPAIAQTPQHAKVSLGLMVHVRNKRKERRVNHRATPASLGSRLEPCELRLIWGETA